MKFPVKKNPILILLVLALIPLGMIGLFTEDFVEGWIGLIIMIVVSIPLLWALVRSYHEITEDSLIVTFGPIIKTIPLSDIQSVSYTYNPLSSPAWTFKRIAITQSHYKTILISVPQDDEKFKKLLEAKCPSAKIELPLYRK
ncbi:PH domain-containing protein [Halobacillus halophilus]|uniref:PH domain-containing protein n=1 Tax=Halobacillus halophilus TaxID=1570 RepID=UPI001CD63C5D|nr:PH domain-containing protein [Halobacillus halophilus]MCA1011877.1 PH domain-containing protein [Halobacillus halophilus]